MGVSGCGKSVVGEAVAKLFSDPESKLEEDLNRFKQVAESGDFAAVSGGNIPT